VKVNILVDMREKVFLAGIEKIVRGVLNRSTGQILEPTKLLIQITLVVCCLGNVSILFFSFLCFTVKNVNEMP